MTFKKNNRYSLDMVGTDPPGIVVRQEVKFRRATLIKIA